jgi:energy-coupling factor transport system substrate-specific component
LPSSEGNAVASSSASALRLDSSWRSGGLSLISILVIAAVAVIGVAAFLYPFTLSEVPQSGDSEARAGDAPLIFAVLLVLALAVFVVELARDRMNAKTVSLLAVIIVAAAALRLPTLPAGASAFFLLVILGGYVFGSRLGFLIGSGGIFVSSFAIGGFGPWLPYQMFAAGWVGMTAGWLGLLLEDRLRNHPRTELILLALFGCLWGFVFGAIMNIWFWPYAAIGESISWQPGMGIGETIRHYWSFYLLTSAGWDAWRAAANALLILATGGPLLHLLVRYRDRFQIRYL